MDTLREDKKLKKTEKRKKKITLGYVLGSAALFAAACVTVPVAMAKVTSAIYKATNSTQREDDDWGPAIERKTSAVQPVPDKEGKEEE